MYHQAQHTYPTTPQFLYSPGYPGTHFVDWAGFSVLPVSAGIKGVENDLALKKEGS